MVRFVDSVSPVDSSFYCSFLACIVPNMASNPFLLLNLLLSRIKHQVYVILNWHTLDCYVMKEL